MKKRFIIILLSIIFCFLFAQSVQEIAKNTIKSTVSIVTVDQNMQAMGYGSGFYVDKNIIATNFHVIENCYTAYVIDNNTDTRYEVNGYTAIDRENDLILLKVEKRSGSPLSFAGDILPEIGERIYAIGNPKGLEGTFSEGIISGKRVFEENEILQITAPISPGSSGGPVINQHGKVIGIAFASMINGQNLNFAIPVKYLQKLILQSSALSKIYDLSDLEYSLSKTQKDIYKDDAIVVKNMRLISPFNNLLEYTVYNNLDYAISDIKILFIGYGSDNEILDYQEIIIFPSYIYFYSEYLLPHLAKSFGEGNYEIKFGSRYIKRVEARILDYKIRE